MIAIHTKFMGATNHRAARIKAYSCEGHAAIVPVEYDLGEVERHLLAARALIAAHLSCPPDHEVMTYGGSADGRGYTFCFLASTISMKVQSDE
jgi:hypothetical protein